MRAKLACLGIACSMMGEATSLAQQVNLSLPRYGAIPASSDSLDNGYATLAGAYVDENPDTAWITGLNQSEHWARLTWVNATVTISEMEMDFRPLLVSYVPPPGFASDEPAGSKRTLTTVVPDKFDLEVRTQGKWVPVSAANIRRDDQTSPTMVLKFDPPLSSVSGLRLHLPETHGNIVYGLREWKVMGEAPVTSAPWKPKWTGLWIWANGMPSVPNAGILTGYFRKRFDIADVAQISEARVLCAAYDRANFFLNGESLGKTPMRGRGLRPELTFLKVEAGAFRNGANVFAIQGESADGMAIQGVLAELWIKFRDGTTQVVATDGKFMSGLTATKGWNTPDTPNGSWVPAKPIAAANGNAASFHSLDFAPPFPTDCISVREVRLTPPAPKAGERFKISLALAVKTPLTASYGLVAKLGQSGPLLPIYGDFSMGEVFSAPGLLPKDFQGEQSVELSGIWPEGAPPRFPILLQAGNEKTQAKLEADGPLLSESKTNPGWVTWDFGAPPSTAQKPGFSDNRIGEGGRVLVEGKPIAPIAYTSSLATMDRFTDWATSGVNLFRVGVAPTLSVISPDGDEETHLRHLFDALACQIEPLQALNGNARFILYVDINAPNEWVLRNPDSQIVTPDGTRLIPREIGKPDSAFLRETPNAPDFLAVLQDSLRQFVTRLAEQPYADRVVGICLVHGRAGENYWGGADASLRLEEHGAPFIPDRNSFTFGDVGTAARRDFSQWLKGKYQTNEALRAGWKMPDVTFEDLTDPVKWPGQRFATLLMWRDHPKNQFMFRDPTQEGAFYADFVQHHNAANAECFLKAGQAIKQASGNRLLVGGYLGYVLQQLTNSPPASSQQSGHSEFRQVLESPDFDFSVSPDLYSSRRAGDPVIPFGVVDSLPLHGKIWLNEFDSRTYLSPIPPKTFGREETLHALKKEFGYAITKNQGWWWYEFPFALTGPKATSWYGDEKLLAQASLMKRIYDRALTFPAEPPAASCAVLVDVEQPYYTDAYSPANTVASAVFNRFLPRLCRLGLPFDLYAQSDLENLLKRGWLKNYQLLFFVNAYHLDQKARKLIQEEVKKDGRSVVFLFAPGVLGDDEASATGQDSLQGIEKVTGLRGVRRLDRQGILGMLPASEGNPFDLAPWWEGTQLRFFGNEIGPIFYLDAAASNGWEKLASLRIDRADAAGKTAVARLRTREATVYYSTLPDIPTGLLSEIVKESGVHVFASQPGVLTWANSHFLCVSAPKKIENLVLSTREPVTWIEPFEGKMYAHASSTIMLNLAKGETRFFCLAKGDEWKDFITKEESERHPAPPPGEQK